MKKQLITLLTVFTLLLLSCTAALAETGAAHTGGGDALAEVENTEKFYYTLDGQTVTVSLNCTLDFDENTDKTAMLDGELVFDSDGNMPYDINIDFVKDNESIATDTIKSTTAVKQIIFGAEIYDEHKLTGKKYRVAQRPDKAVISFDAGDDTDIPHIIVPVVSEDVYEVYGRVLSTARTDADLNANQVMFRVEKPDYFDGERTTPMMKKRSQCTTAAQARLRFCANMLLRTYIKMRKMIIQ